MSADPQISTDAGDLKALAALVVDNEDLETLEGLLAQFNIFEALRAVRHELRHSDVLAFLLDPNEAHGLGDLFARRLLQRALARAESSAAAGLSPVDLDILELEDVEVHRERGNIDVLVLDRSNRLAVILENKIGSSEHSDQLARYWDAIAREFGGYRLLGLFLTPDGDAPSDGRYIAVDYRAVAEVIDKLVETRSSTLGPDVSTLLKHYAQMLWRHIVSDSQIAELCRRIYQKHRRALDLIFEHRPDRQQMMREELETLLGQSEDLVLDDCSKAYIRFTPKRWDVPILREGHGWTKTHRMLLFEFLNLADRVYLKLLIGPGPASTRERIFNMAMGEPTLFKGATKSLGKKHNTIFGQTFLGPKVYEDEDDESLRAALRTQWSSFVERDLPALVARIDKEPWLWADEAQRL
jgi:hypothetical protein